MPATTQTVRVALPDRPYDIRIEPGLIDRAGAALRAVSKSTRVGVVTDSNVGPIFLERLSASMQSAGFDVVTATLSAGEQHKTLPALLPVFDTFLGARFERSMPIIALGGGVVGDMTGFVAATLLRGVPFIQMPTTLLSMVDASVGGKTGVDHAAGKNLIGAFHQPAAVLIDPQVLTTLPPREFRSGLAECIKHEIIRDADGFAQMEEQLESILRLEPTLLAELIAHNVQIKANVVIADPFEHGERAHLNFGHTFGHAIESVSQFAYAHGEAIALGMCAATFAATELKMIDPATRDRIRRLVGRAGLPTSGMMLDIDRVMESMYFDKKVNAGRIRFVLPDRIGHVAVYDDLSPELVKAALDSLRG